MASIRERKAKDGSTRYQVIWREPGGKQCSKTARSKREATRIQFE
jgi:hypothetical protein